MILSLLFSFLCPVATGMALCFLLWPHRRTSAADLALKAALGAGLGVGLSSCLWFVGLALFGHETKWLPAFELLVLAVLLAGLGYRLRRRKPEIPETPAPARQRGLPLLALLLALFVLATFAFAVHCSREPSGGWDAWAVWNLKARFLFRGEERWSDASSHLFQWSHPDYPLLVPAAVYRGWRYLGREHEAVPIILAGCFMLATAAGLSAAVSGLRGWRAGALAGSVLLATPFLTSHAAQQYADVPLGFFYLACLALLCATDGSAGLVVLAGLAGGLAAWTKNEGLMFLLAVCLSRCVARALTKAGRRVVTEPLLLLAGAMPALLIIAYFKAQLAPPGDLLARRTLAEVVGKLGDPTRYGQIGKAVVCEIADMRKWFGLPLVMVCYVALMGVKIDAGNRLRAATSCLTVVLTALGYAMVYLITPHDLAWHLDTSLDRLLLQLWPAAIFTCFLAVRDGQS